MVNQDIVNYILEGKKRGFDVSLLKDKLIEGGFQEGDVDDALKEIKDKNPENQQTQQVFQSANPGGKEEYIKQRKGLFWKIGKIITKPKEFFENTENEGFSHPLVYQLLLSILPFVIISIMTFIFSLQVADLVSGLSDFLNSEIGIKLPVNLGAVGYVLAGVLTGIWAGAFFVFLPLSIMIYAGITHMFVKLFKGKASYTSTYKALLYSFTPMILMMFTLFLGSLFSTGIFTAILIFNLLLSIWTFILSIFGLSAYHKFSKLRAFFSLLMVGVLCSLIVLGIVLLGAFVAVPA